MSSGAGRWTMASRRLRCGGAGSRSRAEIEPARELPSWRAEIVAEIVPPSCLPWSLLCRKRSCFLCSSCLLCCARPCWRDVSCSSCCGAASCSEASGTISGSISARTASAIKGVAASVAAISDGVLSAREATDSARKPGCTTSCHMAAGPRLSCRGEGSLHEISEQALWSGLRGAISCRSSELEAWSELRRTSSRGDGADGAVTISFELRIELRMEDRRSPAQLAPNGSSSRSSTRTSACTGGSASKTCGG